MGDNDYILGDAFVIDSTKMGSDPRRNLSRFSLIQGGSDGAQYTRIWSSRLITGESDSSPSDTRREDSIIKNIRSQKDMLLQLYYIGIVLKDQASEHSHSTFVIYSSQL